MGGVANPLCTTCAVVPPSGYGSTFGNLFDSTAPDKGVGFSVNIPIRNRSAQADQIRSELEYSQSQMRLQQLQNQIRIEVRNAQYALEQNRARVDAAQAGARLAAESLDAEQKKYLLGASTNYNVLQSQRDLAQSESNLVAADRISRLLGVTGLSVMNRVIGLIIGAIAVQFMFDGLSDTFPGLRG